MSDIGLSPSAFERLGAFFLGGEIAMPAGGPTGTPVLYDSKDLTTHAVIVGMTGSGKTGLAIGMLEEAAIDGIPSIAIDVKGDLTNLLLTFPHLRPEDFRPWIDRGAAARKGKTVDEMASSTAALWQSGLAEWGQGPERIQKLRDAVNFQLLTPGSSSGVPLSLLGSLGRPPGGSQDPDAERAQIMGVVSGLLALLGIDADPIQSREHILLSNILSWAWGQGRELTLADLIRAVQQPPFDAVGVIDLESFYPTRDRTGLALAINNLLASPSFQSWREGQPLSIPSLLSTPDGKPRHSILYLAHLSDAERMFFVTRLLNDVVAWMRTQSGTGSLRALIYMDEVFGYLPPSANPPSKQPLLTLLKQARAFGVGVVLATQNPVDLDYKALSNAGTWLLGRLQTERDKMRVLDGLEGAAPGGGFDRGEMDKVLSGLGKRCFLLHNVHEDGPVLFQTRWAMSYLAGPLTLDQAAGLSRDSVAIGEDRPAHLQGSAHASPGTPWAASAQIAHGVASPDPRAGGQPVASPDPTTGRRPHTPPDPTARRQPIASTDPTAGGRPILPPDIEEVFLEAGVGQIPTSYEARLLLQGRLHYVLASWGLDEWREVSMLADPREPRPWEEASLVSDLRFDPAPATGARFVQPPSEALRSGSYKDWTSDAKSVLYRDHPVTLYRSKALGMVSEPGETEAAFRMRLQHGARELRDVEMEKLRGHYKAKADRIESQIETAEERVAREESQYQEQKMASLLDVGTTVLGSLFGRKRVSMSTVSGVSRAAKRFGRASKEKDDIAVAQEKVSRLAGKLAELDQELEADLEALRERFDPEHIELESKDIAPRKSDIGIDRLVLAWYPV